MTSALLRYIECNGTSRQMGRQYGEAAREEIRQDIALRSKYWRNEKLNEIAEKINRVIQRFIPDVLEELEGIAEGADVNLSQVLLSNHVDTFGDDDRCTPVMLRESPEGVIVAKNNDGPAHEKNPFVIRKCTPDNGIPFIHVTYAGWLCGMDAMNAAGLANTHGSVGSKFDKSGDRLDIRLYTYHLLRSCRSTAEFVAKLAGNIPLTGKGFSIAVGDKDGGTVMLDAAVPFVAVRDGNRQFCYSTNLYMSPGMENADMRPPEKRHVCVFRNGYLRWVESECPPRNINDVKKILSSHEPWAPCRHGGVHGSVTLWSMINLPQSGKVLLATGNPCCNEYKEYSL